MKDKRIKAVFNWSGGKDSALALWKVLQSGEYDVISLLTTVNRQNQRSSMHAIPAALLQKQSESVGIPLYMAELEPGGEMQGYENTMREAVEYLLQTVVVTTMAEKLGKDFIGCSIDGGFVKKLPEDVDVCGENGEYHTFCYAGGMFRRPVDFVLGEPLYMTYPVRLEDGHEKDYSYWFANLSEPL